jgi:hypothetical protein
MFALMNGKCIILFKLLMTRLSWSVVLMGVRQRDLVLMHAGLSLYHMMTRTSRITDASSLSDQPRYPHCHVKQVCKYKSHCEPECYLDKCSSYRHIKNVMWSSTWIYNLHVSRQTAEMWSRNVKQVRTCQIDCEASMYMLYWQVTQLLGYQKVMSKR